MTYNIIRSKRKTVAIHITKEGQVEVRAPYKAKQKDINAFVLSKKGWIEKHLKRIEEAKESRVDFTLDYGKHLRLMGKTYPIVERLGDKIGFDGQCFYMPPGLSPSSIKEMVIGIYKQVAKGTLTHRTMAYARETGLVPATIKVNSAKTRWGSCSSKKSINFSWRLIMADEEVVDYVIVHELAHLKEMNHSPRFWALVEAIMSDYKKRQKRLKEFQKVIAHEDWG